MNRQKLNTDRLTTISWIGNSIIEWASAGKRYGLDGQIDQLSKYHYGFGDSAITSDDGRYAFIYRKLGTKGLLLKDGDIVREINRSYYCADVYEYPAAFITIDDRTFLIHCPLEYCRLDFEDVETGEIVTNSEERDPSDFFHSRLEVSPNGKYFMSKGWFWHPWDGVRVFDINACLINPRLLDQNDLFPDVGTEVCTASFIDDENILIGCSGEEAMNGDLTEALPPNHIAVWNVKSNKISSPAKVNGAFGNLFAIDHQYAWDTFQFPKIINIQTGEVVDKDESVESGFQQSSIIRHSEKLVKISFNSRTKQLAIAATDSVEIFSHEIRTPPHQ